MDNVVEFPVKRIPMGLIHQQLMHVTCTVCQNQKKFYGKAMTNPLIVIEQTEHDQQKYEITEVGYTQSGFVQETIDSCAECGSNQLTIEVIQEGSL